MLEIIDLTSKSVTSVRVFNGDESTEFVIGSIINRRNKEELSSENQYKLVNMYLDYKGQEFKNKLFDLLKISKLTIRYDCIGQDLRRLPVEIVHPILDMLDPDDIFHYVKHIYRITPPPKLKDEFDQLYESDGRGTRVQTYLKDDYYQLAALCVVMKIAVLPIFDYAFVKAGDISTVKAEYILFDFIKTHKIFQYAAMQKLLGLVGKLVDLPTNGVDSNAIRILEKQIPKAEMAIYALAVVVMQRLSIATIVDDTNDKNIINSIYNYGNNKLRESQDVSKTLRDKVPTDVNDGSNITDKESILETYRLLTDLPYGKEVQMTWAFDSIEKTYNQLPASMKQYIDINIVNDAADFCRSMATSNISPLQVNLLGFIFKSIQDPRNLGYLPIDGAITNQTIVGFAYLWGLGFKNLAILLTSQHYTSSETSTTINSSSNRSRIPPESKKVLDFLYPYKRPINAETTANVVEEWINTQVTGWFKLNWVPRAYERYVIEVIGDTNYAKLLPLDLRIMLTDFVIKHEVTISKIQNIEEEVKKCMEVE